MGRTKVERQMGHSKTASSKAWIWRLYDVITIVIGIQAILYISLYQAVNSSLNHSINKLLSSTTNSTIIMGRFIKRFIIKNRSNRKKINLVHSFFSVSSFLATMFEDDDALCTLTVGSGTLLGLLFFPWLWLHFFLSIDFLIWIVLPRVLPMLFRLWFSLFYLLGTNSFDFAGIYFTFTDDSFILLIAYCWFWQKFFCTYFSNSIIFLSLSFNSFWKALFIIDIFYNFRCNSWFFPSFYRNFSPHNVCSTFSSYIWANFSLSLLIFYFSCKRASSFFLMVIFNDSFSVFRTLIYVFYELREILIWLFSCYKCLSFSSRKALYVKILLIYISEFELANEGDWDSPTQ